MSEIPEQINQVTSIHRNSIDSSDSLINKLTQESALRMSATTVRQVLDADVLTGEIKVKTVAVEDPINNSSSGGENWEIHQQKVKEAEDAINRELANIDGPVSSLKRREIEKRIRESVFGVTPKAEDEVKPTDESLKIRHQKVKEAEDAIKEEISSRNRPISSLERRTIEKRVRESVFGVTPKAEDEVKPTDESLKIHHQKVKEAEDAIERGLSSIKGPISSLKRREIEKRIRESVFGATPKAEDEVKTTDESLKIHHQKVKEAEDAINRELSNIDGPVSSLKRREIEKKIRESVFGVTPKAEDEVKTTDESLKIHHQKVKEAEDAIKKEISSRNHPISSLERHVIEKSAYEKAFGVRPPKEDLDDKTIEGNRGLSQLIANQKMVNDLIKNNPSKSAYSRLSQIIFTKAALREVFENNEN